YDFGFRSSTPPPTIICPANIMTMSATSTTSITYPDPMITGTGTTFTCVPPSPFNFPIGTTTVTCTATNAGGSATCSFTVTVKAAKCDTICFRSPQYFLLHLNQLPKGAVVIAGVNYGQAVSTSNTLAIQFALQGNATGIGTLTPLQHFNQEFVAAQLNLVSAGGSGSPTVYNALWSLLSCYKINFTPVTLSNNFTLTPNSTLNDLFEQAISAVRENRTADMGALATIFDLLNGNNPSGHCR
ncbi:MAG TPA: HYR domain-containing protein, partial [Blastocatellia bacterium]|nr:HYR domain-containing protein [Blastocatellia bacterium]